MAPVQYHPRTCLPAWMRRPSGATGDKPRASNAVAPLVRPSRASEGRRGPAGCARLAAGVRVERGGEGTACRGPRPCRAMADVPCKEVGGREGRRPTDIPSAAVRMRRQRRGGGGPGPAGGQRRTRHTAARSCRASVAACRRLPLPFVSRGHSKSPNVGLLPPLRCVLWPSAPRRRGTPPPRRQGRKGILPAGAPRLPAWSCTRRPGAPGTHAQACAGCRLLATAPCRPDRGSRASGIRRSSPAHLPVQVRAHAVEGPCHAVEDRHILSRDGHLGAAAFFEP